ncbi:MULTISPECIES: hypothetical protein [Bacillus]|uniref:hypothetical protein n=1 Tax=Bacillus TaxID=1386 RepID=UPI00065BB0D7|nr:MULTISPECIES: hypothetical protein [Bacillus cereus group]KMP64800.1 hypothetical protein TU61_21355 [Bacillus cereus]KMP82143.1 hypothetical protein TU63_22970 [Bacillus cereus]KXY72794.1 hypothetical protein AT272_25105 [Bacillus cereus]MCC2430628.1 hypothetical protein [Bacillus paranthracis]MCC2436500.1 hypothetical protein [Bacillus paranthracis]
MFKDIYVLFPPEGKESIEFQFFLDIEGEKFYEYYKEKYKDPMSDVSAYFPMFQNTYESYLERFLYPYVSSFKEIRLGRDTWENEGIWFGIHQGGRELGILLPRVDFTYYKGALSYKNWRTK